MSTTHKVADLIGAQLDAAVGLAQGLQVRIVPRGRLAPVCEWLRPEPPGMMHIMPDWLTYVPSTDWAQGGPILEMERIAVESSLIEWNEVTDTHDFEGFRACLGSWDADYDRWISGDHEQEGRTYLVAAMRCYVASKFGETIELP